MGKYQLVRRLATGGMAEVFLAKAAGPMGFEKELVVKRILPHLAEDPRFVEMFLTEAKLAARLNHGNCVQIFDFGEQEDAYFIAMEYVEGLNLKNLSQRANQRGTPISFPLAARIVSLACEGLAYAHELVDPETEQPLGFIHRDISTDNILVSLTGGVKVVDFGIAKAANVGQQTQGGVIKGKLAYMPPEYLSGQSIDSRADIYALGVVLYELIAGRKPFLAETEVQLTNLIIHKPAVDVRTLRPDVPEMLAQVVERALNKDRQARYSSCRQMQADLERFLFQCGEPVGALQIAELVKTYLVATDAPARRNSREFPAAPSPAPLPSTAQVTRSLRPPSQSPAPKALVEDTVVTPPPVTTATEEELLRLVTRPRWHRPMAIAAGLLLLGGAGIVFVSQEQDSHPAEVVAAHAEEQVPASKEAPPPSAEQAPPAQAAVAPPAQDVQALNSGVKSPSAQEPPSQQASKPSPEPETAPPQPLASDAPPPTLDKTQLTVTTSFPALIYVDGVLRNKMTEGDDGVLRPITTKKLSFAAHPKMKRIEVDGTTFNSHNFTRREALSRLREKDPGQVNLPIRELTVTITDVPAGMVVEMLDGHTVDTSTRRVDTYEGIHELKAKDASGRTLTAWCDALVPPATTLKSKYWKCKYYANKKDIK